MGHGEGLLPACVGEAGTLACARAAGGQAPYQRRAVGHREVEHRYLRERDPQETEVSVAWVGLVHVDRTAVRLAAVVAAVSREEGEEDLGARGVATSPCEPETVLVVEAVGVPFDRVGNGGDQTAPAAVVGTHHLVYQTPQAVLSVEAVEVLSRGTPHSVSSLAPQGVLSAPRPTALAAPCPSTHPHPSPDQRLHPLFLVEVELLPFAGPSVEGLWSAPSRPAAEAEVGGRLSYDRCKGSVAFQDNDSRPRTVSDSDCSLPSASCKGSCLPERGNPPRATEAGDEEVACPEAVPDLDHGGSSLASGNPPAPHATLALCLVDREADRGILLGTVDPGQDHPLLLPPSLVEEDEVPVGADHLHLAPEAASTSPCHHPLAAR